MSRPFGRKLGFEPLEDRRLLAIVTVNTTVDENNGTGNVSLREAVAAANSGDTIQFAANVTGTINLASFGEIQISKSLTIQGPGSGVLTVRAYDPDGSNNSNGERIFLVDGTGTLNVTISGLTLPNGDPSDSDETGGGGAIVNRENLTLNNCVLTGNFGPNGGAIYNLVGALTINDSTISNNNAGDGAGILVQGGSLSINRSTVTGNQASNAGAGIMSTGPSVSITDSTISLNVAAEAGGGYFQDSGSLTVTNSTFSQNSSTAASGGAIYNLSGSLSMLNSTVSGNSAETDGGAIFSDTSATITFKHSTITLNRVASGSRGGGLETIESASFDHTIVANNFRGSGTSTHDDVHGPFTQTFSLIGIADPKLAPLANNGGPTFTHALLSDSPALEAGAVATAGSGGVPLYDQRGTPFSRVVDYDNNAVAKLDIGAIEMPRPAPALPGDYNLNHEIDAADYVMWRKTSGTAVAQPYAGADGNGDQNITTDDYVVWREGFGNTGSASASLSTNTIADSGEPNEPPVRIASMPISTGTNNAADEFGVDRSIVSPIDHRMQLLLAGLRNYTAEDRMLLDEPGSTAANACDAIFAVDELDWLEPNLVPDSIDQSLVDLS